MNRNAKARAPMLVLRTMHNTGMELRERAAITAFTRGCADHQHYEVFSYILNLLLIAGNSSAARQYAYDYAENTLKPVVVSIRNRYMKTGKLGVSGVELKVLQESIEFSKQFWLRQPSELFITACQEVDAFLKAEAERNRQVAA